MSLEQQRKENRREVAQRDEELEDVRCSAQKKVKGKYCYKLLKKKGYVTSLMFSFEHS
jgi:hypothetical protein